MHGAGLVKGEGFAVDASVMEADASRYHGKAPGRDRLVGARAPDARGCRVPGGLDDEDPDRDRKPPKVISPVDPCSAWTAKANKRVQFGYGLNYLIDVENAVIVDVEATPARTYDEVAATKTMIERTERALRAEAQAARRRHRLRHRQVPRLAGRRRITPHIPVWDKSEREDGTFSRADFKFDQERNVYICPAGKLLADNRPGPPVELLVSRVLPRLRSMPAEAEVLPKHAVAQVPRDVNEAARDVARAMGTPEFESRATKEKGRDALCAPEDPSRLRAHAAERPLGARDEFHLAAIVAEPQDPGHPPLAATPNSRS